MKFKKELYDDYVETYKQRCIENNKLIPYDKLRDFKLPDARYFIKNSAHRNINNFIEFQRYCGFIPIKHVTKEECDRAIQYMLDNYGENICYDDFRNPKLNEIAVAVLNKYYGSLNNMKLKFSANINKESMYHKSKSKEEMLSDLYNLYLELGRTPLAKEINNCSYCLNSQTYTKEFGSLYNSFIKLNIKPNKKTISIKLSNDEIINIYKDFINSLGFVPSYDFCCGYNLPSPKTVMRRFNMTWIEFLTFIGFDPINKQYGDKYEANDGTLCLSWFEQDIHNILLSMKLDNIEKEKFYKDFVSTHDDNCGLMRCDWYIENNNNKYVIEYFGMMEDKKYVDKVNRKLNVVNSDINKDYTFIALYQNDFKTKELGLKLNQLV